MYIKVQTRIQTGADGHKHYHSYPRLYESYRDSDGKTRQQYLLPLNLDDLPSWRKRETMCHILNDMVENGPRLPLEDTPANRKANTIYHQLLDKGLLGDVHKLAEKKRREQDAALKEETLKNVKPRQVGAEFVCLETLRQLGLRSLLVSNHWTKEQADLAMMQIAARAIYPCSENRTVKYLQNNSALCEFFGTAPKNITKDRLYRSALRLFSLHKEIEDFLYKKVSDMFELKDHIFLYDLTNAYMESTRQTELRKFGRSKEKRSDCPIVVLGAVVDTNGFPVRTHIFAGNTADCSSMKTIMEELDPGVTSAEAKKIVVMDAGISTSENLQWLRDNNYDYITVRRGGSTDDYKLTGSQVVTVEDVRHHPIQIQFAEIEGETDTMLLVDSHAKSMKEKSMHDKLSLRYEEGLKAIKKGIKSTGGTKKRDKVNERLGRLKERCASVQKEYDVTFTYDDKDTTTDMSWRKKEDVELLHSEANGKYIVQTSLKGHTEKQIWSYYNVIRHVEAVFACLKSDLDIRPVYHQNDESVKAHFHLAILAYWIVNTVQYKLKTQNVSHTWDELRRIMSTQIVVSTRAKRMDGLEVEVRQCTEPDECLAELYRKLGLTSPPLKRRRKICVVHFEESQKNDT